jgi:hypothetical protein
MPSKCATPEYLRYIRRFFVAMSLYVVFVVVAVKVFHNLHPTGIAAYLLAILPALPIIAVIAIVGIYMSELKDEFQRSINMRAMVWGIGATLALTTAWGFLEVFSLAPHVELYLVFPLFCVCAAISQGVLKLRYR